MIEISSLEHLHFVSVNAEVSKLSELRGEEMTVTISFEEINYYLSNFSSLGTFNLFEPALDDLKTGDLDMAIKAFEIELSIVKEREDNFVTIVAYSFYDIGGKRLELREFLVSALNYLKNKKSEGEK